tara:strand:+ start:51 stop:275 length:225 start_codon:yes stop_codon:yes gene_type:complete
MIEVINANKAISVAFASRTKYLKKELELAISEGRNVLSVKEYKINSVDVAQLREYGYDIYNPENGEINISWGIV